MLDVLQACAYDPKDRFVSAEALKNALLQYSTSENSGTIGRAVYDASEDGAEDDPTESVLTHGSSVDTGDDGKTHGVFSGVPLATDKVNEEPAKGLESNNTSEMEQRTPSAPIPEALEILNDKTAAAFLYKIKEILLLLEKVVKSMSLFIALYCYNL